MNLKHGTFAVVLCVVAAVLLIWAPAHHPYSYFTLLRWIVCGVSLFVAYCLYEKQLPVIALLFIGMAILFNPIAPVYLRRATWAPIDYGSAVIMFLGGLEAAGLLRWLVRRP